MSRMCNFLVVGPAGSGDPRPSQGHRRVREATAHPFRGLAGVGVVWGGGKGRHHEEGRRRAVVMVYGETGNSGERQVVGANRGEEGNS